MARLPRLVLPDHAHCVIQRGHGDRPVFADAADRAAYVAALREAAAAEGVRVHAWALLDSEVRLLATPPDAAALGRSMQAVGRRYVSAYNRRHGRSGTLWDGRFRCAVVEPGEMRLAVLRWIDGAASQPGVTTASQRLGGTRDGLVFDPPEVWALGNTPFEREAAYGALLDEGLPAGLAAEIRQRSLGGWALGSPRFLSWIGAQVERPAQPRAPGRPRRAVA
jgi:putative transposase